MLTRYGFQVQQALGVITLQLRSQNTRVLSPLTILWPLKLMLSPPYLAAVVVPSP
jgi:hypothetical protein